MGEWMESVQAAGEVARRKPARRWAAVVSCIIGSLLILVGVIGLSLSEPRSPMIVGLAFLAAGLLVQPPISAIARRTLPFLRPMWAPPLAAFLLAFFMIVIGVPNSPSSDAGVSSVRVADNEPPKPEPPRPSATQPIAAAVSQPAQTEPLEEDLATSPAFARTILWPRLRDPESARIVQLSIYRTGKKLTLCGTLNAKNGFGGYSGPSPFIISDNGVFMDEDVTEAIVATECAGAESAAVPDAMLR